ncbi:putative Multi-domain non-ribosomal peptide synthetase [Nitrospira japonica]|uniref:Putative Multi-domain non-ribosomal peptide synthetase n=1 Tax=Nitrospira japonica TaxID=1325564 RepID=A0A1W1IAI7_9BACT|nr:non-ribosomal peptide synthetase [Nitrospira japonica]SLM50068.1 putative Multi-domain non-ribosomal peptide synthetase [Nitrospira japonica]
MKSDILITGAASPASAPSNADVFPASFAQQRLWFLSQLEPDGASYNTALAVRLRGPLNREAVAESLNEIIRRHEVLRTTFDEAEGGLVQVIAEDRPASMPVVDFSMGSPAGRETAVASAARAEAQRPFDLRTGPLMRVRLLKLEPQDHVLVMTLHHIVCDGWSSQILAREFATLYEAFDAGRPSPLPQLPIQYADYAVWQRGWLQGAVLDERLAYWKEQLKGKLPVLDLPTDRPRPAVQTDRGARFPFSIPRALTERLHAVSRRQGATLFMTLAAAFEVFLMRYSGLDDFCVGTPVANRPKRETESLIGFFANTLVLRADLSGNPSFADLLARVQETVLGAQAHQDLPFEQLVDALQPVRSLSHTPLFQVMFALQTSLAQTLSIPSLEVSAMELDAGGAKFDLSLDVTEDDTGLDAAFEYNQDLFDEETVARMAIHLRRLLEGIADDPQARLSELPMLTESERRRMLIDWNDTAIPGADEGRVADLFEAQAGRSPEDVAVSCGTQTLTYQALNDRAGRIARGLSTMGVGCETVVAVLGERGTDYVAMMVGLWKCGAVYLPLDPGHPPSRWTAVLESSRASVVLTTEAWASKAQDAMVHLPAAVRPAVMTAEACSKEKPAPAGARPAAPSGTLAYVIYTSGSTGVPKGAMVTERGLINHLRSKMSMLRLGPADVVAQTASQGFDISVWQLTAALLCGARVLIVPDDVARDPEQLLRHAGAQGVTVLETVPALLQGMLDSAAAAGASAPTLARLRWLLPTGEALPPALISRWFERYPHVPLVNAYGPAECADDVAMATILVPPGEDRAHAPIGKPIANVRLYVVDEWLEPVPIGASGELCVAGIGVGRGYLHDPAKTAGSFVPDPFSSEPGSRLYRTGDRVRCRPDGTMEFLGRRDHQVKIRGVRIELGEIESRLQAHPEVREAAAVVRQDHPGQKRLVAYVASRDGAACDADGLITLLREQLPEPMVPSVIMKLAMLPRGANGKIDRQALPRPDHAAAKGWTAPRTSTEAQLAAVWAEVLGLDRIGVHDNFFELGGDSILSLQVISRAKTQGFPLTPRHLFQHQTIAELAGAAGGELQPGDSTPRAGTPSWQIDPAVLDAVRRSYPKVEDAYPLTPLQQGLLFHSLYEPQSGVYIEQLSCLLRGSLDQNAFLEAWRMVIARSTPLRSAFMWQELNAPMQVVLPGETPPFVELDWRGASEPQQRERLNEFLRTDRLTDFDLTRPPLMRLALIRVTDDARYLIWTHHHIVLDGWCLPIILGDLFACYASLKGGPTPDEPHAQSYRDYVGWILSQDHTAAEQYWRKTLADITSPTPLPADRDSDGAQPPTGYGTHRLTISAARTAALQAAASKARVTVNTVIQGAWALLLSRYSGEEDVVFGTTVSGRSADVPGIETMLGLFINTLPLRVTVSSDAVLNTWLRGLLQQNAELRQYEHTSLAQIQTWSQLPRGRQLFDSLLVFDNHPTDRTLDDGGAGLTAHDVYLEGQTNYPLTVNVVPGESLCFLLSYQHKRFSPDRVKRLAEHLDVVLDELMAQPQGRLAGIEVVGPEERQQVVREWNATARAYGTAAPVPALIYGQVQRTPAAVAVRCEEQTLSYGALWRRSAALAVELQRHGVGPDVLVGICAERSLELVVGLLGILQAGGAYVPIDPSYPAERIAYMLGDAAPGVLLTQPTLRGHLPPFAGRCLDLPTTEPAASAARAPLPTAVRLEHLAYTIYTSGSTGRPKGAGNTHGGLLNRLQWMQEYFGLTPADRVLQKTPIGFDVSVWEFFWPLLTGAELVLAQPEEHKDGLRLVERIVRDRVTTLHFVPPMLQAFLETPGVEACAGTLRRVICSGEALAGAVQRQCWAKLPGVALHNLYGPTEAAIDVTVWSCAPAAPAEPVPIGRPIANTQIYLLDRRGVPVPAGVPGELYIGGVNVARGYHQRPGLTAERFVPDAFGPEPGRRLYRTGDLARHRPDGAIEYLGRLDHQVKIRGVRIELGEIESCLYQHPAVQDAVVVAQATAAGSTRLVGYVVPRAGQAVTGDMLRQWVGTQVPEALVPSVVVLAALPLTPNGKVDRRALPVPEGAGARAEAYEEPATETERVLATIWAEVLAQPRVGRRDNFFELGGDSILSLQIIARAKQLGLTLTPRQLFQYQTPAELAEVATRDAQTEAGPAMLPPEQGPVAGDVPLTPVQHWFFEHDFADPHRWNQSILLEVKQPLNHQVLAEAMRDLVRHHDMLRARFDRGAQGWRQRVEPESDVEVHRIDLSAWSKNEFDEQFEALAEQWQTRVHLSGGPLLLVVWFDRGKGEAGRLLIVVHHLVMDGVSWRVLLEDLQQVYLQRLHGQPPQLPAKTTSFKQWALKLSEYAQSNGLSSEASYWLTETSGTAQPLPVDHPDGARTETSVEAVTVTLGAEQTRALLYDVAGAYHTRIDDLLLTALAQTVAAWTGRAETSVDVEWHGREDLFPELDLSRTVGWFTAIHPVVLRVEGRDAGDTVKSIKEQLRRIPGRGVGYGVLRYLRNDETGAVLRGRPASGLCFNYFGQLDRALAERSMFDLAQESVGKEHGPANRLPYELTVNAEILRDRLSLTWSYSGNRYRRATIERLGRAYLDHLQTLIDHCTSSEAGGYTPSDFPDVEIGQDALDTILGRMDESHAR